METECGIARERNRTTAPPANDGSKQADKGSMFSVLYTMFLMYADKGSKFLYTMFLMYVCGAIGAAVTMGFIARLIEEIEIQDGRDAAISKVLRVLDEKKHFFPLNEQAKLAYERTMREHHSARVASSVPFLVIRDDMFDLGYHCIAVGALFSLLGGCLLHLLHHLPIFEKWNMMSDLQGFVAFFSQRVADDKARKERKQEETAPRQGRFRFLRTLRGGGGGKAVSLRLHDTRILSSHADYSVRVWDFSQQSGKYECRCADRRLGSPRQPIVPDAGLPCLGCVDFASCLICMHPLHP